MYDSYSSASEYKHLICLILLKVTVDIRSVFIETASLHMQIVPTMA